MRLQSATADRDRPALVDADDTSRTLTHGELTTRVADAAATLPPAATGRRLVQVPLTADVDVIVGYLAVLLAGHVALVTTERADTINAHYRPDLCVRRDGRFDTVSRHPQHLLHPDLAVLLSTSGSTGSPKLVRLSQDNVLSNADAIVAALSIGPADRAITSLPLHYCFVCRSCTLSSAPGRRWCCGADPSQTRMSRTPWPGSPSPWSPRPRTSSTCWTSRAC